MCSCYFNTNSCACCPARCYRTANIAMGPVGPQGPMGPMGPQGPQGPQGTTPTSQIAGFSATTATALLTQNAFVPLNQDYNFDPTDITFTSGNTTMTLANGYYLVTFDANASGASAGEVGLGVSLNGTTVPNSVAIGTGASSDDNTALSSSFIIYAPTSSTLALVNPLSNQTSYSNVNLVVQKLNV